MSTAVRHTETVASQHRWGAPEPVQMHQFDMIPRTTSGVLNSAPIVPWSVRLSDNKWQIFQCVGVKFGKIIPDTNLGQARLWIVSQRIVTKQTPGKICFAVFVNNGIICDLLWENLAPLLVGPVQSGCWINYQTLEKLASLGNIGVQLKVYWNS